MDDPRPPATPGGERARIDSALEQVRALRTPLPVLPGYALDRELFRGGQGVVYHGVQRTTGQEIALKILREDWRSESARLRFEREVALLVRLRHKNLVAIHDCGVHEGRAFYVMDYVAGRDLDQELAAEPRTLRRTVELLARVCEAVGAAHVRGVLHRDLKPSNIRIDRDGEPRLLDFGLAKELGEPTQDLTTGSGFLGSAPWASPEQVAGEPLDVRSDVYALGVILYQALTGRFPYPVDGPLAQVFESIRHAPPARPSRLRAELDRDLDTILLRTLAKEPERRYQSALDLARDLGHWLAGRPIDARRDHGLYVLGKTLRRHWLASAATLGVLVLLATAVASVVQSRARWRDAAERLDAKLHGEELRRLTEAYAAADRTALEAGLAAVSPEHEDWIVGHLRARLARQRWSTAGDGERVLAAAFAPDGSALATGTWQGTVSVLEPADGRGGTWSEGRVRWSEAETLPEVRALAFDPTGATLLALASDGLAVYDAGDGGLVRQVPWPPGGLEALSVGAELVLAAGSAGKIVGFAPDGALLCTLSCTHPVPPVGDDAGSTGVVLTAVHAPSRRAASAGSALVRLWDVVTGEIVHSLPLARTGSDVTFSALAFSDDGQRLAIGTYASPATPGGVLVLDARTGERVAALENLDVSPMLLSASGRDPGTLWIGERGGGVRRVDLARALTCDLLPGRGRAPDRLAFASDGQHLAVVAGALELWQPDDLVRAPARALVARALAPDADGRWWCAGLDAELRIALAVGDDPLTSPVEGARPSPAHLAVDPRSETVVAAWPDGSVRRLHLDGRAPEGWELGLSLRALALSGDEIFAAASDGALLLLGPAPGATRLLAQGPRAPSALAIGGACVAVAHGNELALSARDGEPRATLALPAAGEIRALVLLEGEQLLAAATASGELWLVDTTHAEALCALPCEADDVAALAYDPARRALASLSLDGRLRVRDPAPRLALTRSR